MSICDEELRPIGAPPSPPLEDPAARTCEYLVDYAVL
jgi:hypothetical protein